MTHEHGRCFDGHWPNAMIANHAAEITLCRAARPDNARPACKLAESTGSVPA
jgi:hypothetical protein